MVDRRPEWIAAAAGGVLLGEAQPHRGGPTRVLFEADVCGPGDLFVPLPARGFDTRDLAEIALANGAWGLLVGRRETPGLEHCERPVISVEDPVEGVCALAGAWRRELRARVVGVTGSCGKTSTKDILTTMLTERWNVVCTPASANTTTAVAATILGAPRSSEVLVLEIGTRQHGGITEVTDFARPDLGIIVTIGPSHLTPLGGLTGVARAKAELVDALPPGGTSIIPTDTPLLDPYLRDDLRTVRFGDGGDVRLRSFSYGTAEIDAFGRRVVIRPTYDQPHLLHNTLAATAAAMVLGHTPQGDLAPHLTAQRCETVRITDDITLINDCYNASPLSMKAGLEYLAVVRAQRRVAVLGTMGELGDQAEAYHTDIGRLASRLGVDELITVGRAARWIATGFDRERDSLLLRTAAQAAEHVRSTMRPGDVILVKGASSFELDQVRIACLDAVETAA